MNYPVPFFALCALGSKLFAKKYPHSSFIPFILAIFCSGIIFYAGFAHLISSQAFYLVCWLPALSTFMGQCCAYFGYEKFGIPASIATIACLATPVFIPLGIFKTDQAGWSLCLISSVIATLNTDYIKPAINARRKKHEFSI